MPDTTSPPSPPSADPARRPADPLRWGLVGIGKMGVSHLAIAGAHPGLEVAAVCDSQGFLLSGLRSQVDIETYKSFETMLDRAELDCLFIATPTRSHFDLASEALGRGIHLFVEKPLTLAADASRQLADQALAAGVANQVGYHNRFIATFREAARLVASGAIGDVHHIDGRAYGAVVTKVAGGGAFTWRSRKSEGGGCLHDYACHVIDLMNLVVGPPEEVVASTMTSTYSRDVEDAVHAIFTYPGGATGTLATDWSDPSHRKMTTSITVYGSRGKVYADRQELQLHVHEGHEIEGYETGWNVRYITELQPPVSFYLRGEEYSAQVDAFVEDALAREPRGISSFATAAETDRVVEDISALGSAGARRAAGGPVATTPSSWSDWFRRAPVPDRARGWARSTTQQLREAMRKVRS